MRAWQGKIPRHRPPAGEAHRLSHCKASSAVKTGQQHPSRYEAAFRTERQTPPCSGTPTWTGSPPMSATARTRESAEPNGHGTSRRRTSTRPAVPSVEAPERHFSRTIVPVGNRWGTRKPLLHDHALCNQTPPADSSLGTTVPVNSPAAGVDAIQTSGLVKARSRAVPALAYRHRDGRRILAPWRAVGRLPADQGRRSAPGRGRASSRVGSTPTRQGPSLVRRTLGADASVLGVCTLTGVIDDHGRDIK